MSDQFMNEFSLSFVMDLHRIKINAEKRGDAKAIESLKRHYPELFSEEFTDFIKKAKLVASDLDQKYNKNFSSMFEPDDHIDPTILH